VNALRTIALATLLDIARQPIILLLSLSCLALTGLLPAAAVFAFGEEARLVRDGAMALHLLTGLLLAGAAAAAGIHSDIKRGGAATILCKPVSRSAYFLATYAGVAGALLIFSASALCAGLLSARMVLPGLQLDGRPGALLAGALLAAPAYGAAANFWFRRPFVSHSWMALLPCLAAALGLACALEAPGREATAFGSLMAWNMAPAGVLVAQAILVLAALAVSFSTRLPPILSTSACAVLFGLGLIADYVLRGLLGSDRLAGLAGRALPQWQNFWAVDALAGGGRIPWDYVADAGLYAGLYVAAALAMGLASFRHTEIV